MGEQISAFDKATESAWSRFRARLADHVAEMTDADILIIDTDPFDEIDDGAAPYVQFCAWGQTRVRCEVSSNEFLGEAHRLDDDAVAHLVALGWAAPTYAVDDEPDDGSANFHLDVERLEADRLAVMAARALRGVFGVVHPAFVAANGLEADPDVSTSARGDPNETSAPDELLATMPRDRDHLQELVDEALTPFFGHPPKKDDDGDIPIVTDTTVVYVRVLPDLPVVHLFCRLVRDVADHDAARFETGVLNRDGRFVKYSLVGDAVMAEIDLPARPFAPAHVRDMVEVLCSAADSVAGDLVHRVGGRREIEPDHPDSDGMVASDDELDDSADDGEPASVDEWLVGLNDDDGGDPTEDATDPVHPAMQTLLQLDADRPGSLTPEIAASVCSWDRDLVLELITWNSEQEIAWRRARDRAAECEDTDEADVCEIERAHAERSVALLRGALRLVVEAQVARSRFTTGCAGALGRVGSPSRNVGDEQSALPGLEPLPEQDRPLFEARPLWLEGGRA